VPAEDDAGIGGVVADGVEDLAHRLGVAVELLDAGVDDLDGGLHVVGGVQHVLHLNAIAFQPALEDEGELHLDPRRDEAVGGDVARLEEHVVQQRAVVRLVDLAGQLHGARRQADLVAAHLAALGDLHPHPGARDGIAVLDGHAGKAFREVLDLHARLLAPVQFGGELPDGLWG
jgi:hypothetical protein